MLHAGLDFSRRKLDVCLLADDGEHLDLAAVDILRDRERGVPRYNQFRRLFHKDPVKSFDELTENPEWRRQLKAVYNNDLESVDLMTGLYAEPLPEHLPRITCDAVEHGRQSVPSRACRPQAQATHGCRRQ